MTKFWQTWDWTPIKSWVKDHMPDVSVGALQITAVVLLHAATLPSYLSVMMAWTDAMPPLDMVILTWTGIACMFAQSMIQKNSVMIITIAVGFMLQSLFMALIFFR
jgi:hypothetical protein